MFSYHISLISSSYPSGIVSPIKMKIKGLHNFITEVNDPKLAISPEDRIQNELFKIKKSFIKKSKKMYLTKKGVAKLCYIELYGCHVTFGFPQIQSLIKSRDSSDNFFGWIATVIIIGNNSALLNELIPEMRRYLVQSSNDLGICFVLNAISSIKSTELAESIGPSIADIVIQSNYSEFARKKAMLILAKIYNATHHYPAIDRVTPKLSILLSSTSYGIQQCAASLTISILQSQLTPIVDVYSTVINNLVLIFEQGQFDKERTRENIPDPFLVSKFFKILRLKSDWTRNESVSVEKLIKIFLDQLDQLILASHTQQPNLSSVSSNSQLNGNLSSQQPKSNSISSNLTPAYMVLYEIADLSLSVPLTDPLLQRLINHLISLITNPDVVIKAINFNEADYNDYINKDLYISVFALQKLTFLVNSVPHCAVSILSILPLLLALMQTRQPYLDARALDLLYSIANQDNGMTIVDAMLIFLPNSPLYLRESLCNKAAVLIQSYGTDDFDSIVLLIRILNLGGKVLRTNDKIWRSIVHTISNKPPELQQKVTEMIYRTVSELTSPPESLVKLSSYLLGEYVGLCNKFTVSDSVKLQLAFFETADSRCQSIILTSLMKIAMKADDVKPCIIKFFDQHTGSLSFEVAQRSKEYLGIFTLPENMFKRIVELRSSNVHVVDDIFEPKQVSIESKSIPSNASSYLKTFQSNDTGILLNNLSFILRAAVRYEQPRLTMIVNIENLSKSPLIIKSFDVASNDDLRFRIGEVPFSIESQNRSSITIDFVMMNMTDYIPILNITFEKRNLDDQIDIESVSTPLPILFNRWMLPFEIDKESFFSRWSSIVDTQLVGSLQLMIPDGDVMKETESIMKRALGLDPLKFDLAPNNLVAAGAFNCFKVNIGVLIRFVYDEENMDLSFQVKANVKSAIKIITDIVRKEFLS